MEKESLKLSICIPVYNGGDVIDKALESIFKQSYQNFEIVVSDDGSTDNTAEVIKSFKDKQSFSSSKRIKYFRNPKNLGYGENLNTFKKRVTGEAMVMMACDDILLKDALLRIVNGFLLDPDIGVVTRPFYQFEFDPLVPVRYWPPPSTYKDTLISLNSPKELIEAAIVSTYLISGLAYRVKYLDMTFPHFVFTSQAYPFFSIFKKHKILYLKDYVVAVAIYHSQCRHDPSIYEPSPLLTWIQIFNDMLKGKQYDKVRKICHNFVAQNYVGLIQIKNWARTQDLFEEIYRHVQYRKLSLIDKRFWAYSLATLLIPRFVLRNAADFYKSKILSKITPKLKIKLT